MCVWRGSAERGWGDTGGESEKEKRAKNEDTASEEIGPGANLFPHFLPLAEPSPPRPYRPSSRRASLPCFASCKKLATRARHAGANRNLQLFHVVCCWHATSVLLLPTPSTSGAQQRTPTGVAHVEEKPERCEFELHVCSHLVPRSRFFPLLSTLSLLNHCPRTCLHAMSSLTFLLEC